MTKTFLAPVFLSIGMLASSPSIAQTAGSIDLQLNNAVGHDGVCRLSFLVRNGLDVTIKDMGLEIVLLNKNGLAQDFMMLRTGELTSGKRRVRQFDLPDVTCTDLGEVLINDVADCQAEGLTGASCLASIKTSTKTSIKLGL